MGNLIRTFRRSSLSDKIFYTIVDILMLAALMMVVIPIMNVISNSISEPSAVLQGKVSIFPKGLSFDGYKAVFADNKIISGYANTILYTVSSTVLGVIVTVLCAYPLSRKDLKGRNTIMFLVTFTMLFSGGIIPNYLLIRSLHLINSRLSLILPGLINAYNIIIARTFFQSSIPDSLLEAAEIDGANQFQSFITLVLPMIVPAIFMVGLLSFVGIWNEYVMSITFIKDPTKYTLSAGINELMNDAKAGQTLKFAALIIAMLPILIIYAIFQKPLQNGLSSSDGVKG